MNFENQDLKLKTLIQVCKETGNLKKMAIVCFELISRKLDEIGVKLGVRKRLDSGETLVEYMELINQIFLDNLGISIFQDNIIEKISECEPLFLKNRGNIPFSSIRTIFKVFYELRKLDVPNLHREFDDYDIMTISPYRLRSFFSSNSRDRHNNSTSVLEPMILQKIKEKQLSLQKQSQNSFNRYSLETAISLKNVENSIRLKRKQKKIKFEGKLKDSIRYQQSVENVVGYFIIGVVILLFILGISILLKLMIYPNIISTLSYWSMILIGGGALLLFIYIQYFIRRIY
ncbi:MAG: hypothetical protein ACFFCE_19485 [Promethearchaeota archaeon]